MLIYIVFVFSILFFLNFSYFFFYPFFFLLNLSFSLFVILPDTPQPSFNHPDWQRMLHCASGKCYYYNKKEKLTTWAAPPPPPPPPSNPQNVLDANNAGSNDDDEFSFSPKIRSKDKKRLRHFSGDTKKPTKRKRRKTQQQLPRSTCPSQEADVEVDGTRHFVTETSVLPADAAKDLIEAEAADKEGDFVALKATIDPTCSKKGGGKRYLVNDLEQLCLKYDLSCQGNRKAVEHRLTCFFMLKHDEAGTQYLESECFQSANQEIERTRVRGLGDTRGNHRKGGTGGASSQDGPSRYNFHRVTTAKREIKDFHRTCPLKDVLEMFPDETFFCQEVQSIDDSRRKLFRNGCEACGISTSKHRVTTINGCVGMAIIGHMDKIKAHVATARHKKNLEKYRNHESSQLAVDLMIQESDAVAVHQDVLARRAQLLKAIAKDGLPATTLCADGSGIRSLLEGEGWNLVGGDQMKQNHELALLECEVNTVRLEIAGKDFSIVYDETPRHGALGCCIVRYVEAGANDENPPTVCQRLCAMTFDKCSLNAGQQMGMLHGMGTYIFFILNIFV